MAGADQLMAAIQQHDYLDASRGLVDHPVIGPLIDAAMSSPRGYAQHGAPALVWAANPTQAVALTLRQPLAAAVGASQLADDAGCDVCGVDFAESGRLVPVPCGATVVAVLFCESCFAETFPPLG